MNVLIVNDTTIPALLYGGTERVIWDLGEELSKMGHNIFYLVKQGSHCHFAKILPIEMGKEILDQIPDYIDIVHFNVTPKNIDNFHKPYIITIHGNSNDQRKFNINSVFVSQNHAERHGSCSFVYNGLNWDNYLKPDFTGKKEHFHFLGKAAWRVKNVQGAIDVVKATRSEKLVVMGGHRFNFKMGIRFTFSPKIKFYGMVGGRQKDQLLQCSKGLIFPVRWHEPFGLAIIESLYFGNPIFATPYGSLPELVGRDYGFLSENRWELVEAIKNADQISRRNCHEYALENYNSNKMALSYLDKYEIVLSGMNLNPIEPQLLIVQDSKLLNWNTNLSP